MPAISDGEAWVIIPAAGEGKRFGNRSDKLMVTLGGLPILVWTVEAILDAESVTGAVIVVTPEKQALYQRLLTEYGHSKPRIYTEGGATRRESVYRGLQALPETASIVVIHDAARPLVTKEKVDEAVALVRQGHLAVVTAIPILDTVKQVADPVFNVIAATMDRQLLWRAQTPQVFERSLLLKAHDSVGANVSVTDDAQLMELARLDPPIILPGHESNLKITTPADLALAEAWLKMGRSAYV